MACNLAYEDVWIEKYKYEDAERIFYENKNKDDQTPLADEVGRARQWLTNIKNNVNESAKNACSSQINHNEDKEDYISKLQKTIMTFEEKLNSMIERVIRLEELIDKTIPPTQALNSNDDNIEENDEDVDVDLFGSDSEEDEAALKVRQKRLEDYEAKKSKKVAIIAKSNIILDIKPWDDETNMKLMEEAVRNVKTNGLVWGAAKLVPLAFGIYKLQISCVVEDELVSVDWLQEEIEGISDYVQSVDIAAFNKV